MSITPELRVEELPVVYSAGSIALDRNCGASRFCNGLWRWIRTNMKQYRDEAPLFYLSVPDRFPIQELAHEARERLRKKNGFAPAQVKIYLEHHILWMKCGEIMVDGVEHAVGIEIMNFPRGPPDNVMELVQQYCDVAEKSLRSLRSFKSI